MKSRILTLALIALLCTALVSCSSGSFSQSLVKESVNAQDTSSPQDKPVIALVMKTLTNPFFVKMEEGARRAEEQYGIELLVRTGAKETSIEQQIQIVDDLILKKVDAIVIAPGSSTDLVEVLKKAQDAGIVIVNIDNRLDAQVCEAAGLLGVPFISVKNDEGAYLSVQEITKLADSGEALIFEGIADAENSRLRVAGARKAFEEMPNISIVASESANWKIDEAYDLAKTLFAQHPDVKLVFCANDMMALGVVQYLKETDRKDILLAGFDNLDDARTAMEEGWMTVTIDQQADVQGFEGVKAAVELLKGGEVDQEIYIPVKVIDHESLNK